MSGSQILAWLIERTGEVDHLQVNLHVVQRGLSFGLGPISDQKITLFNRELLDPILLSLTTV